MQWRMSEYTVRCQQPTQALQCWTDTFILTAVCVYNIANVTCNIYNSAKLASNSNAGFFFISATVLQETYSMLE